MGFHHTPLLVSDGQLTHRLCQINSNDTSIHFRLLWKIDLANARANEKQLSILSTTKAAGDHPIT